ncbi:hypothetical protein GCM10017591_26480 [Microbacterium dextranolyticum]|uniref:Uncharacterized protein n=1 Tax=Microbacterium dextranolyticum TaxID=36806 RepID=A0A9W6M7E9_9MICO|nr:hypothetical protein GCM10017591_26480 [Microbacterium dextranolyticum]
MTFADKSLLMGSDAAEALLEYARLLGDHARTDAVTLRCLSPEGNTVEASFLLNENTALVVESTNTDVQPPDNTDLVLELRDRIGALQRPVRATEEAPWPADIPDDLTGEL